MPDPVDLSYAIGLAPEEAINYFRAKGYAFSWNWHEVWQEAHAKAFTVAKAMKLDILQDIRKAVDDAISKGTTFQDFQNELAPLLKAPPLPPPVNGVGGWEAHTALRRYSGQTCSLPTWLAGTNSSLRMPTTGRTYNM